MDVLFYNSYNLFFPQYLNTESTYQLFCNTALSALLRQSKAYYGGKKCLLWEIIRMDIAGGVGEWCLSLFHLIKSTRNRIEF